MEKFNTFFESYNSDPESIFISSRMIYNFYFLFTFLQTQQVDRFSKFLIDEFSQNIKTVYLRVFSNLISRQLKKYQERGRVDNDFKMEKNMDSDQLYGLMQKTYRSDMKRRNDRWIELAKWVDALYNASDIKSMFFAIDRINNTTHNTRESILSKFTNSSDLLTAFDNCHKFVSLDNFRPYINKEYAKLL